jgi:hypothetical protein
MGREGRMKQAIDMERGAHSFAFDVCEVLVVCVGEPPSTVKGKRRPPISTSIHIHMHADRCT